MPDSTTECEAKVQTQTWPYVKKCRVEANKFLVYVRPIDETLDLCKHHYSEYLSSCGIDEARLMDLKYGSIT